jgi:fermentation-respiration switch protein FrsA (DUF1100 family)
MWQMTILDLEDGFEYVGLLAAVSGLLLVLTGSLALALRRLVRRLAMHGSADMGVPRPDAELFFWSAVQHRGTLHLAVGGGVFALVKMIDVWMYPGGLL